MNEPTDKPSLLAQIVERRQHDLFRFAYFRIGSRAEAEDAVQEVLLRLFRSDCDLGRIRDVERYLLKALANRCADYHRRQRNRTVPLEQAPPLRAEPPGDDTLQAEYRRIAALLDTLPPEQAEVIRMKTSDSLTFGQIAEVLGIAEATVKSRFRYGIEKLRKSLHAKTEKS